MAFYPLVTDPDNNSDIYLSGWTLVCTRHIQLSCIFPTTIIFLILALTMNCLHMTWDSTVKGSPPKEAKSSPLFTVSTTAGTNLLHTSYARNKSNCRHGWTMVDGAAGHLRTHLHHLLQTHKLYLILWKNRLSNSAALLGKASSIAIVSVNFKIM